MANFSNILNPGGNPKADALGSMIDMNNPTVQKNLKTVSSLGIQVSPTGQVGVPTPNASKGTYTDIATQKPFSLTPATPKTPQPSTAVKSHSVGADGSTKTEYHAPAPAPANTVKNGTAQTPEPPKFNTQTGQPTDYGNSQNQSQAPAPAGQTPGAPAAPKYANPLIQPALEAQERAVNINQALNQSVNDRTKQGIALPFVQGQQGAIERDYGVQAQAATQSAQNAALLAGFGQPQPYSLLSQPYNPLTDTYGGGGSGGAINRSIQASNIGSAGDFQTKIQQTEAGRAAADANFSILNDYAVQGGSPSNVPIISGLLQKYGQIAGGQDSPQVAGFKSQLQAVRAAYQALVGGDPVRAIPDAITPDQLKQVQQSLSDTAKNNITSYKNQLGQLQNGTGSSTPTAGVQGEFGSWPGWNPQ